MRPVYELKIIVSGSKCATFGMVLLIFENSESHYNDNMNEPLEIGFTTTLLTQTVQAVFEKLLNRKTV